MRIKENIKHHLECYIEEGTMQVTAVRIQINHPIKLFKSLGRDFIIGGDFSAKTTYWGSKLTTSKGKELLQEGQISKCEFYSGRGGSPTYWPSDGTKIPDLIDFHVARSISQNYIHIEDSNSLVSDHSPVQKESAPRLSNSKTNWVLFRELMEGKINLHESKRNSHQLEDELEQLNQTIHYASLATLYQKDVKNASINRYLGR